MTTPQPDRARLAVFLVLTFGLSAVFWWIIVSAGSLGAGGGRYVLTLMWSPGLSALITRLIFQRDLRGQGWGIGPIKWSGLAYILPLFYGAAAYGLVWLAGLGTLDLSRFRTPEFGAGLVVTIGITAWLFWRARGSLPTAVDRPAESLGSVPRPAEAS